MQRRDRRQGGNVRPKGRLAEQWAKDITHRSGTIFVLFVLIVVYILKQYGTHHYIRKRQYIFMYMFFFYNLETQKIQIVVRFASTRSQSRV